MNIKDYKSNVLVNEEGYFHTAFFEKTLKDKNAKYSKAYVCGPPSINKNVPSCLEYVGILE